MTNYNNILLEVSNDIAVLTVNRPKSLNALNKETLSEIKHAALALENGDVNARILIITGAGDKAFVAGADIKEMANMNAMEGREFSKLGNSAFMAVQNLSIPTIAAINGYALGGGLELSMACDIRFASNKAIVGLPEVGLGVIPGFGGTQRLPRIIGLPKAKEYLFTGGNIKADEALEIGLFNRVFEPEELMNETMKYAEKVLSKAPISIKFAKAAAETGYELPINQAVDYEAELFGLSFSTEDQKEGMAAFVEKRQAEFKNK